MNRVLILGRPNVGKSSLFNRLIRQKKALVVNQPGVTRDILKAKASWWGVDFEVWDSGGLWSKHSKWGKSLDQQVCSAIQQADLVVFVMDVRSGLLDEDKQSFRLVKKSGKKFLTVVNKVDEPKKSELLLSGFHSLGVNLLHSSFEADRGVTEIVEWIVAQKDLASYHPSREKSHSSSVRLLVAGKINVGKSSLCNALLKKNRMLTSSFAGTTMDVVDDQFQYRGKSYALLDTAGVRKLDPKKSIENLANFKSQQKFSKVDIILLLVESTSHPSRGEARMLQHCAEEHKPVIMVVNKWDLALKDKKMSKVEYRKLVKNQFHFYPDLPVVFTSALHSSGLSVLLKKVDEIYEKLCKRISTSELNKFFTSVIRKAPAPVYGGQDVKFYYLTQTQHTPPAFVAFANYPQGIKKSYRRFLIHQIQNRWNLKGIPIRIFVLSKNR